MPTLDTNTRQQIIGILLPFMQSEADRITLLETVFISAKSRPSIDTSGDPLTATRRVVVTLSSFGNIEEDVPALWALLQVVYNQLGLDKQARIDALKDTIYQSAEIDEQIGYEIVSTGGAYVFISYSRQNLTFVRRLIKDLQEAGVNVWVDKVGLKPGNPDWEQALRDAIAQADGVILVASESSRKSPFVRDELAIAKAANRKIFPVWAEGGEWSDAIPMGMGYVQFTDMRGNAYKDGLRDLVATLTENLPNQDDPAPETVEDVLPPDFEPRNPFKGLRAFHADDRGDFFGRDTMINKMLETLAQYPNLLAVVGASGSGKSSAIMAGLLPKLADGALPGSENWKQFETFVPGEHPIEKLAEVIAKEMPQRSITSILDDLFQPAAWGLRALASQIAGGGRLVLYIDQFEELFTLTTSEDERRQFINLITTAANDPYTALTVILSMRADFYDRPMNYPELGELIDNHSFSVLPMSLADLYDVVQGPSSLDDVRLKFDDGLVTELIFEVREETGALPLLQFTLDQLFEQRDGIYLTYAAYEDIGGVRGALAKHAEATYQALDTAQKNMARALFLRLIEPGLTEQDTTRRRATRDELTFADKAQTEVIQQTMAAFTKARLLVADENTIEVAHEALIARWERLGDWLEEARDDLQILKKLSADVAEWRRRGRQPDDDGLYRGELLAKAQGWAARNIPSEDEVAFIRVSEEAQQAEIEAEKRRIEELKIAEERAHRAQTDAQEAQKQADHSRLQAGQARRIATIVGVITVIVAVAAGIITTILANSARDAQSLANNAGSTLTPVGLTLEAGNQQIRTATVAQGVAIADAQTAAAQVTAANDLAAGAQTQVSAAENTLTPIAATLVAGDEQLIAAQGEIDRANSLAEGAQTQVAAAEATLTPIAPTLTAVSEELSAGNTQVAQAGATLTPIQPTLTAAADQLSDSATQVVVARQAEQQAQQQASTAQAIILGVQPTLDSAQTEVAGVEPTLAAAEARIAGVDPTLTSVANELDVANAQVAEVGLTLTPVAPTLTAVAGDLANAQGEIDRANQFAAGAQTEVAQAGATLTPVESTLTAVAGEISQANEQFAVIGATLTPVAPTLTSVANQLGDSATQVVVAQQQATQAQVFIDNVQPTLDGAETRIAGVEPTLAAAEARIAGVEPTLTAVASELEQANAQFMAVGSTLTPVPPTLTAAANSIIGASTQSAAAIQQAGEAQTQVAVSGATLTPVPATLTAVAGELSSGSTQVAAANTQVAGVQPTVEAAGTRVAAVVPTVDAAETRAAGAQPTVNAAGTQIAVAEATLSFAEVQAERQGDIADALRLVRSSEQLLNTNNPDLAIALALQAYQLDPNIGETQRILTEALPLTTRLRFGGTRSAAISPDERFLAVATSDEVSIWDPVGRVKLHGLPVSDATVLRFSPESQQIYIGRTGRLQVFDAGTGEELFNITLPNGQVTTLDLHPTMPRVIIGGDRGIVSVVNLESREVIAQTDETTHHRNPVTKVVFNENGTEAYSFDLGETNTRRGRFTQNGEVYSGFDAPPLYRGLSDNGRLGYLGGDGQQFLTLYDADTFVQQRQFSLGNFSTDDVENIAFSEDGRWVLVHVKRYSGSDTDRSNEVLVDQFVAVWSIETSSEVIRLPLNQSDPNNWNVHSLTFSPDKRFALVGMRLGEAYVATVWDLETGEQLRSFSGHTQPIIQVSFSDDMTYALTQSSRETRLWDITDTATGLQTRVTLPVDSVQYMAVNATGDALTIAYDKQIVGTWSITGDTAQPIQALLTGEPNVVAAHPTQPWIFVAAADTANVWDIAGRVRLYDLDLNPDGITAATFSDNGRFLFVASRSGFLSQWDMETGEFVQHYDLGLIIDMALSPNNQLLLYTDGSRVRLHDLIDNRTLYTINELEASINDVAFSPREDTIVVALAEPANVLLLYNAQTAAHQYTLIGHRAGVRRVVYNSDGLRLLSGAEDGSVILWDSQNGQVIREFMGHEAPIESIVLNPQTGIAFSRSTVLEEGILGWRVESAQETVNRTYNTRYIPEISCQQRLQFNIAPLCEEGEPPLPEPTPTLIATPTIVPTSTPRPTPTPTPTPVPMGTLQTQDGGDIRVRTGPGTGFSILDQVPSGTRVEILGFEYNQAWVEVRLPDGRTGWVSRQLLLEESTLRYTESFELIGLHLYPDEESVFDLVASGVQVSVIEARGRWSRIRVIGTDQEGWILTDTLN